MPDVHVFMKPKLVNYSMVMCILLSYAASSTTVAMKNSVLFSFDMMTTGSSGVSSSSSLLPDAVFVGSSWTVPARVAVPSAVSANLATEKTLRDFS